MSLSQKYLTENNKFSFMIPVPILYFQFWPISSTRGPDSSSYFGRPSGMEDRPALLFHCQNLGVSGDMTTRNLGPCNGVCALIKLVRKRVGMIEQWSTDGLAVDMCVWQQAIRQAPLPEVISSASNMHYSTGINDAPNRSGFHPPSVLWLQPR